MASFIQTQVKEIRAQVGQGHVICAMSGGVDSSVVAMLMDEAIGKHLTCIFVDNGLLRHGEKERVEKHFKTRFKGEVKIVDASARFLKALDGVTDPERKRKIIGGEFIAVFEEAAKAIGPVEFLVQGTLYPDVIESVSVKGPSATIKSHHNVGGLPERMHLKLIEPARYLFKDEVRLLGKELGLPDEILQRHPFRDRDWRCACWERSLRSVSISSGEPTISLNRKSAPPASTIRCGRLLRCSCR